MSFSLKCPPTKRPPLTFDSHTETGQLVRRLSTLSIRNGAGSASVNPFHLQPPRFGGAVDVNSAVAVRSHILPLDITPPGWSNGSGSRLPMVESPLVPAATVEDPVGRMVKEIMDKISDKPAAQDCELPTGSAGNVGDEGIQAAVLIGIRRRKMKKHKLKKLRKKMKFEWAKVRVCVCRSICRDVPY